MFGIIEQLFCSGDAAPNLRIITEIWNFPLSVSVTSIGRWNLMFACEKLVGYSLNFMVFEE